MGKSHYTNEGIRENGTFSVNLPTETQAEVADYCGLVSGKDVDKAEKFDFFYGSLKTAPMISQCPVNMECRLVKTVDFPTHDLFVGEVVETHADEDCLTGGVLDYAKVRPLLFVMSDRSYRKLGGHIAQAWSVGKSLKGE
ncbi:MAG: flavin reductase family protein [Planctomycetota bacterium]|jgi:flavin reductase (DIM6/NTAB) family NADH-FMN oxidoreductase RutF